MEQKEHHRKQYTSDLTDEQWAIVAPLIPPAKQNPRGGRPRKVDMREVRRRDVGEQGRGCYPIIKPSTGNKHRKQ